ncbi:hypothetical protein [Streptomyces sp. NPDC054961]
MSNDAVFRESTTVAIDRSIFGVDEDRSPEELDRPYWVDLSMDSEPVRVGLSTLRVMSLVGTHDALVTVEILREFTAVEVPGFKLLGEWSYQSSTGKAYIFNIDGPVMPFPLEPNRVYTLRVWRRGGETAVQRYSELLGAVFPIEGLEEYVVQFRVKE